MTTSQKKETATRFCCAAAVFALAFPGPVLPLTAVMVCVLGTFIFLYRYRCMQGQPARLWYLAVCLLWLWSNTGINLSGYFTCAPLSLSLLAAASLLCMGGAGLSGRQRLQRLGAFFTPVVFLALIPYALRASETGTLLTNLAIVLLSAEWVFSLIGAAFPQTRRHSRFFIIPLILIVAGSGVAASILGSWWHHPIFARPVAPGPFSSVSLSVASLCPSKSHCDAFRTHTDNPGLSPHLKSLN